MKMFEDLKSNQAVKLGNVFVICLTRGEYLDADGTTIKLDGFNNQFISESVEGFKKVIHHPAKIVKYIFDGGVGAPADDYYRVISELNGYYDDDLDEHIYPDLETEFKIKKQLEEFQQAEKVYSEPSKSYEDVVIEIVGAGEDSGSDFINSPIQYGRVNWNSSLGTWKVDCGKIAKDAFEKATSECKNKDISSHSNINYAKVNGKFLFTHDEKRFDWIKNNSAVFITDDLQKALEKEEFIRKHVTNRVNMFLNEEKLSKDKVVEVWEELKKIRNFVQGIDSKQKTTGNKSSGIRAIDSLMKSLEEKS